MNREAYHLILAALWAVAMGGLTWYVSGLAMDITYITMADGRRQERRIPMLIRILLPMASGLSTLFKDSSFKRAVEAAYRKLVQAGYEGLISAEEFLAVRLLSPLVLGSFATMMYVVSIVLAKGAKTPLVDARSIFVYALIYMLAFIYPVSWLNQAIAGRHKSILRALPFVMDLLTLSVEAGMDFMIAIKNIVSRRDPDPIGEELSRMLMEIQLGTSRRDAMRHLGERVNHTDVLSLMMSLIQSDEMGASLGATLRIQSEQIRTRRFVRAEKMANEAPVKMLFPLVAFIFPAVFLVLLGPIILQMLRYGF